MSEATAANVALPTLPSLNPQSDKPVEKDPTPWVKAWCWHKACVSLLTTALEQPTADARFLEVMRFKLDPRNVLHALRGDFLAQVLLATADDECERIL